ncbi:unnamed protein product [Peronospora belbahrii]|uniref:WRKY19-like zinc finger domain-containing protein n=1 Tax=Peronospora belbahrii TaxID=622444 RepID=A0AAU9KPF2_9STRA|nr:unnamed protein product [Peronospora belbahrii]
MVGSPTSPSMTPANSFCLSNVKSTSSPTLSPKTRRPLSLHDLLSADMSSTTSIQRSKNVHRRRQCGIADCHKYALTGGFCIRHGGGKRCNFDSCQTVAQSGGRCKAHGGGSKCKVSGCGSVARRKGFCMTHGGRQQCKIDGCSKCAHGGGFCISHGGGKRCSSMACKKSAQAGGFCYSHGGGKRCAAPECFQAARKGGLCIRHRKSPDQNGFDRSCDLLASAQRLGADNFHSDALLGDSLLNWDDDLLVLPESTLEVVSACRDNVLDKKDGEKRDFGTQNNAKTKKKIKDVEQVKGTLEVDECSELFSCMEQNEATGVDNNVFVEDEDAMNAEVIRIGDQVAIACPAGGIKQLEIERDMDVYTPLEVLGLFDGVAADREQEAADAENVAMVSKAFLETLEDKEWVKPVANSFAFLLADYEDATNVEMVADFFTALEDNFVANQEEKADQSTTCDWIDALEVDNMSLLFSDLEEMGQMQAATQSKDVMLVPAKVDPRVFVPPTTVRMDGDEQCRPRAVVNSDLLAGPPGVVASGFSVSFHAMRDHRRKSKRKTLSFRTKQPDPLISDTRRASAAKRQRVKGRFVCDTQRFVSITSLQK